MSYERRARKRTYLLVYSYKGIPPQGAAKHLGAPPAALSLTAFRSPRSDHRCNSLSLPNTLPLAH